MNIFLLDVDRTIVPFPATSMLYKRMFLSPKKLKYLLFGILMLILMHFLWFWKAAVHLQRKIVMTFFAGADPELFAKEYNSMAEKIIDFYNKSEFKRDLEALKDKGDKVYLLSHCPKPIAENLVNTLGFNGEFSLKVDNYFSGDKSPKIFEKHKILQEFKQKNPKAIIYFFADDLVDLKCLKTADVGILVNGTWFTRTYCKLFCKQIQIWQIKKQN